MTTHVCYLCGAPMKTTATVRLFRGRPAILFCGDEHAAVWDATMEAGFARLSESFGNLGRRILGRA